MYEAAPGVPKCWVSLIGMKQNKKDFTGLYQLDCINWIDWVAGVQLIGFN